MPTASHTDAHHRSPRAPHAPAAKRRRRALHALLAALAAAPRVPVVATAVQPVAFIPRRAQVMSARVLDTLLPRLRHEPTRKRVRATPAGEVVLDSTEAVLVWEPQRALPAYKGEAADVTFDAAPLNGGTGKTTDTIVSENCAITATARSAATPPASSLDISAVMFNMRTIGPNTVRVIAKSPAGPLIDTAFDIMASC